MNFYIKIITSLIYKDLLRNMFVIAIYVNVAKILKLKNKAFFGHY